MNIMNSCIHNILVTSVYSYLYKYNFQLCVCVCVIARYFNNLKMYICFYLFQLVFKLLRRLWGANGGDASQTASPTTLMSTLYSGGLNLLANEAMATE